MNENLAMLLDGLAEQVGSESLHLAFLAIIGGANIACGVVGWLLLRAIRRNDDDQKKMGCEIARVDGKVDANDRRHGYEISDLKIAVAPLFSKAGVEQPDYPTR